MISTESSRDTKIPSPASLRLERNVILAIVIIPFAGLVAAVPVFWRRGLEPFDLALFAAFYLWTGFGITVGYHRLFTHKAFEAAAPLRFLLATAGSMAVQGPVIRWVADHRRHHQYSDRPGDPHSPHAIEGHGLGPVFKQLWYAHIGWFFDQEKTVIRRFAPDLLEDRMLRFVDRFYVVWILASLALPAAAGYLVAGPQGALSGFLFAGLVRIFMIQHVTWSVNSICHYFGSTPFHTADESRNNWVMALPALGEGWHNNHHAFPSSARQGLKAWQIDPSYWLICGLEKLGLATRVRRVAPGRIEARRADAARPT